MRKNGLLVGLCLMTLTAAPARHARAQASPARSPMPAIRPAPHPEKLAQV